MKESKLDWIYERVINVLCLPPPHILPFTRSPLQASKTSKLMLPWGFNVTETTSEQFRNHVHQPEILPVVRVDSDLQVEFNLLHEFKAGYFFDFHIDTKPNDGESNLPSLAQF